jgi:serine/threonine protein kinase
MSDDSIDLIRKMLDRDLSTRPTMAQVLTHPVFSSPKHSNI